MSLYISLLNNVAMSFFGGILSASFCNALSTRKKRIIFVCCMILLPLINIINENPQAYDQDLVDTMIEMAGVLNDHKQILESDDDIEEEKLQEMIDWYGSVDEWVAQVKEEIAK